MGPMNEPEATAPGREWKGGLGWRGPSGAIWGGTVAAEDCSFFGERCAGTLFGPLDAEDEEKWSKTSFIPCPMEGSGGEGPFFCSGSPSHDWTRFMSHAFFWGRLLMLFS